MLEKQILVKLYRNMARVRQCDEYLGDLMLEGRLPMYHSPLGQEAVGVGVATGLKDDDYVFPTHRGHGMTYGLSKGVSLKEFAAEHLSKTTGGCGGVAFYHIADPDRGFLGFFGLLGAKQTIANGVALAAKKNGKGQVVICVFGDGEWGRGHNHEAMNLSALWKLPIVWICENNGYAAIEPVEDACLNPRLADMANTYLIPNEAVDGNDVIAVYEATQKAVERARNGEGPTMLEMKTYRMKPHSVGMPDGRHATPRPPEEIKPWQDRDPLTLFLDLLLTNNILSQNEINVINQEIEAEITEAAQFAEASPSFDPSAVDLDKMLYAD